MKPSQSESQDEVQGPAIETPAHVWNRPATDKDMKPIIGKVACSKLSPLELAFDKGQLQGGNGKYNEVARFNAGIAYSKLFNRSEKGGRDSTQALNVCRSSTMGANNDSQERAWDDRLCIESHLGFADRTIIRMVCGEEHTPAKAVQTACNDYKYTVPARFRESLDNLIEAMETAQRHPRRFNLEVVRERF